MSEFSNLIEILSLRAQSDSPDLGYTFLDDGEEEKEHYSFKNLDQRARTIGAFLQDSGVGGKQVLLLYQPSLEFIAAFFGCLYAGAVAVPAYPPRPNRHSTRIQEIIKDAEIQIALTSSSLLPKLQSKNFLGSNFKELHFFATDTMSDEQSLNWKMPLVSEESLVFIQYTSGSTGVPKGVMVSHGNLIHNQRMIQHAVEHTEKTVAVGWVPLFHDLGLVGNVLQPLWLGGRCILMAPTAFLQKPIRWLQAISRYRGTTSGGPNFAYDLCVEKISPEQRTHLDLTSWNVAFMGAEPIRETTIKRFSQAFESCGFHREACYPCYGLAEASLFVSGGSIHAAPIIKNISESLPGDQQVSPSSEVPLTVGSFVGCGHGGLDQKILIVDPESLSRCPPNEIGEIWVSGPNVAKGYWNRPEETIETFQARLKEIGEGPYLRTGDLGFVQDHELFVTGRLKDLIIIRGQNHYPHDIEMTVEKSHESLRSGCGAAFSIEKDGEERLVITHEIEQRFLRTCEVEEVVPAIRQTIAEKHDLQVYAVCLLKTASIPKTSSGKIQRYACQQGYLDGSLNVVGQWRETSGNRPSPQETTSQQ